MVPNVKFSVKNGKLGVRRPGATELHAFVGPASSGTVATPTKHSRQASVISTHSDGPVVELAIGAMERFNLEALVVRSTASVASSFGAIDVTGVTGTSVVTKDASATTIDDYEVRLKVKTGGTIGVAGIVLQYSLDGGRTYSNDVALGTAVFYVIPNTGSPGIRFNFAAGTLVANDVVAILAIAPKWSTGDLSTALASLVSTLHDWKAVWIAGPMSASEAATVQTFLNSVEALTGKARKAYIHLRMPNPGESEATYLSSVSTDYASFADFRFTCSYAAARVTSQRQGRPYVFRRPAMYAYAGLPASLPLAVDMAQTVDATPGGLSGVALYDSAGNKVEHDEMIDGGGGDARFTALRTWPEKEGVYVNDPKTLEGTGLDFHLDQFVRILCVYCDSIRTTLIDELSRDLELQLKDSGQNKAGAPNERECQRIDARVLARARERLKGQVSDLQWALNRDDNLLTSQSLTGQAGIVFKGYPKLITFSVSAVNPAFA